MRATCPAHLICLDFTTRTILGKEYRSFSSSLCSFLHYFIKAFLIEIGVISLTFILSVSLEQMEIRVSNLKLLEVGVKSKMFAC
jgi:hypothetical protein